MLISLFVSLAVAILYLVLKIKKIKRTNNEKDYYSLKDGLHNPYKKAVNVTVVCFLTCFIILNLLALAIDDTEYQKKTDNYKVSQVTTQQLVALEDNSTSEGHAFLGCGSLKYKQYYCYYIETENGYQFQKVEITDNVFIKYLSESNTTPYLDIEEYYFAYDVIKVNDTNIWTTDLIRILCYLQYEKGDIVSKENITTIHPNTVYTFYIPQGAIDTNYSIDME